MASEWRLRLVVAFAAIALLRGAGRAEDQETKQARIHYQEGTKRYNLGEYPRALDEFKAAYLAKPDPAFLYNIAQCFRQLHQFDDAAREYRAYRRENPNTPNRADVDRLIADMDEAAAQEHAKKPPTGTEPPQSEPERPPAQPKPAEPATVVISPTTQTERAPASALGRKVGIGLLVAGLGVTAAGIGVAAYSPTVLDSARNASTLRAQHQYGSDYTTYSAAGFSLIGIGAAVAIAGAVVFGVAARRAKHLATTRLAPTFTSWPLATGGRP